MAIKAAPGEKYTIRRKVFKVFGAAFHVYDAQGAVVGYCKQKAMKLREDIRLYTDESCSKELLVLRARQVIDFGATYDVTTPAGDAIASLRRKGMKSSFIRDEWLVLDANNEQVAIIREQGSIAPLARRYVDHIAFLLPQKFDVMRGEQAPPIATLRQHFSPFVYRLGVAIHSDDEVIDDLTLLAAACLIAAIEGRQN